MDIYNTQSFFLDQNPCSSSPWPVSTMALVKLDTLITDFVVNVLQDSLVHTAIMVIEYKTVKWTQF